MQVKLNVEEASLLINLAEQYVYRKCSQPCFGCDKSSKGVCCVNALLRKLRVSKAQSLYYQSKKKNRFNGS